MKIPSSFLYDLVHKLTKSEKRYIKVQSGSKEKDYLQLFDALIDQKVFDENRLIKENKGANFLKHLAVNKRYLYEIILKSLANFGKKRLEDKIFEQISAANVLISKGLFQAASNELKKGQKVATEYEFFDLQILLGSVEKKLHSQLKIKKKDNNDIQQIFDLEMKCLEQLRNTNEYWFLAQKIAQFQMKYQKIQTEEQQVYIQELTQDSKFQDHTLATNFKSKIYLHQANASFHFMHGNVEKAYETNRDFLDLLESYPHFLNLYSERYLATLNNMLIDSLVIGKYDILEDGIKRLVLTVKRKEFKSIKDIESRVFRQRYLLLLNWSISQKDFEKALDWIPEIEKGLDQFEKKIERHHRITFYYLTAYVLFQNKRFDQAIQWNNKILNDSKEDVVKEIFYFARILNLLIHFELKNFTLLESLLLSTPKYLKNRRTIYATEKALFKFLSKIINLVDRSEVQKLNTKFISDLNEFFQDQKEKRVFSYLDLRWWMEKR